VNPAQRLLVALIRLYQLALSPFIGNQCRFTPTCSYYAREAIERHGALKGSWMAMRRVGRCHPWHPGGHDPVPPQ
jgi:putative membrane protein insertion efficiency factor